MKAYFIAALFGIGLVTPAMAADTTHYAVRDTVGNCAVVDTLPSKASGLEILGDRSGYPSEQAAAKSLGSGCKSVVERG